MKANRLLDHMGVIFAISVMVLTLIPVLAIGLLYFFISLGLEFR